MSISFAIVILYSQFAPTAFSLAEETGSSIFYEIIQRCGQNRAVIQVVALLMLICVILLMLGGMFKIRLFYLFKMVPRYTDTYSLYFASSIICRAIPSLCYNFLNLIEIKKEDGVAFFSVVGILDFDVLHPGLGFISEILKHFPMIMIVVSILSFFRVFERIASFKKYRWRTFYCCNPVPAELMENGLTLLRQKRKSKREKLVSKLKQQEKEDMQHALNSCQNPTINPSEQILSEHSCNEIETSVDYQHFNQQSDNKV